jgi:alkylation response protein AidB-like acyl-CoA dehydrogenase
VPAGALLGWVPAAQGALHRQAQLLVAAQLLGMAEASRDMAVDYAQVRMQFGQPIGAFQAVKHRCANMAIGAEALRAQLVLAAIAERDGWPDAAFQVDACRLLAARCALANAGANIQMHGGIGFTAECDAHLFLLRAHLLEHLGGPVRTLRERLAGIDTVSLSLEVP